MLRRRQLRHSHGRLQAIRKFLTGSFVLLSNCGEEPPTPRNQLEPEVPPLTGSASCDFNSDDEGKVVWAPAFIIQGSEIIDTSIAFIPKTGTSLEGSSFHGLATSRESIPEQARQTGRVYLNRSLYSVHSLFKREVYDFLVENNIFSFKSLPEHTGGFFSRSPAGIKVVDSEGNLIACCIRNCIDKDFIPLYMPSGSFSDSEAYRAISFHELLHDAWYSYLTEEQKARFNELVYLLFNVVGDTWQTDQLLRAIVYDEYFDVNGELVKLPIYPENPDWTNIRNHIEEWIEEIGLRNSLLTDQEIDELKDTIHYYLMLRSQILDSPKTYNVEEREGRSEFITIEGFAHLAEISANDVLYGYGRFSLPGILAGSYGTILDEGVLNQITSQNRYFVSVEQFNILAGYIQDFVAWVIPRKGLENFSP